MSNPQKLVLLFVVLWTLWFFSKRRAEQAAASGPGLTVLPVGGNSNLPGIGGAPLFWPWLITF